MIAWMIYVVAITLILSIGALIAEQAARQLRKPGRWIWALAIISSLLIPTVVSSVSIQLPNPFTPAVTQQLIVLRDATSVHLPFVPLVQAKLPTAPPPAVAANWDDLLKRLWMAASLAIFLFLLVSGAMVMLFRRQWSKTQIGGTPVLVATNIGPAVVGLLRPQIVVPAWLANAPRAQQDMVIEHEQSHLDAFDPQLLTIALCLLISMPWNLPLWWQLHRLRRAIEMDCDARVVHGGGNLAAYGETLLAVGERQSGFIGVAAAMSENTSFLEQRIAFLLRKPAKWNRTAAAFLGCISIAAFAVAADVSPPNAADSDFDVYDPVALPSSVIDGYVGNYLVNDHTILTVTNNGGHMAARIVLEQLFEPLAITQTSFITQTVKFRKLRLTFIPDAQGRATAVLFHYQGRNVSTAPRLDDAQAMQINYWIISRINTQTALPGSEAALRRMLAQLSAASPNYAETGTSPPLATWLQDQFAIQRPRMERLGAVKSTEFVGVSETGWDKYLVRYEHGSAQWAVAMNAQGVIDGLLLSP